MLDKLVVKKEIELKEEDKIDIYEYICKDKECDNFPAYSIREGDFKWDLEFYPKEIGTIELSCTLYKKGYKSPLYRNIYKIEDEDDVYKVFMQDTKYKDDDILRKSTIEDVEFYFTFKYENTDEKDEVYIKNNFLPKENNSISNLFGLFNYCSFTDNDLFRVLYSFIYSLEDVKSLSKEKYLLNKLEFLSDKLAYYGYDKDYLDEYKDIVRENIDDYLDSKKILNNDEILQYFIIITLDYLICGNDYLIANFRILDRLSEVYCENLTKVI